MNALGKDGITAATISPSTQKGKPVASQILLGGHVHDFFPLVVLTRDDESCCPTIYWGEEWHIYPSPVLSILLFGKF